jgi:hypothetical protein
MGKGDLEFKTTLGSKNHIFGVDEIEFAWIV